LKLALTVAVGVNPNEPIIDEDIMKWGIDLAWLATCTMIGEAESKIADNDRQRIYNQIYELVRKAGKSGITPGRLRDRLSGTVRGADWKEIIEELIQTARIRLKSFKPETGRPSERYVAREFVAANDNVRFEERTVQRKP
jgi:hypothetical protein